MSSPDPNTPSRVYVPVWYDYENSDYGPAFRTRELAEEFVSGNAGYSIEEWQVFDRQPGQVRCYYAQRTPTRIVTGSNTWREDCVPDNDELGKHIAWSTVSESDARALLAVKEGRK